MSAETEVPGTEASFCIKQARTGTWRRSRSAHRCTPMGCAGISAGERYLATGERHGIWATHNVCEKRAVEQAA